MKDLLLANGFEYFSHVGANDWFVNKKFKHCNDEKLQSSPSLDLMNLQKFAGRPNSKHVNCAKDIVSRIEAFAQISARGSGPQHGEDSYALEQFFFGLTQGVFLEMGALDALCFPSRCLLRKL